MISAIPATTYNTNFRAVPSTIRQVASDLTGTPQTVVFKKINYKNIFEYLKNKAQLYFNRFKKWASEPTKKPTNLKKVEDKPIRVMWNNNQTEKKIEYPDGTYEEFRYRGYAGGMTYKRTRDGLVQEWDNDGNLRYESFSDGTYKHYTQGGSVSIERKKDGTKISYYKDGKVELETLPDGTIRRYRPWGSLEYEKLPDGTYRQYQRYASIVEYEKLPDGTEIYYFRDGNLKQVLKNGILVKSNVLP